MKRGGGSRSPATLVPVLMYHSISDTSTDAFRAYTVTPERFATHLAHLTETGYTAVTVSELAAMRRQGRQPPARTVALTFDDGFRDFVTHAVPLLTSVGYHSTLFVPTGFVGTTSKWLVAEGEQRRSLLSWGELAQLRGAGVECGAHSHSHPQLDLLGRRAAAREIALSKALLEDHLQAQVNSFAYPFGYSKPSTRQLVAALGFTAAVSVSDLTSRQEDDLFAIPRLTITSETTAADLAELISAPRTTIGEATSRARSVASRALRQIRVRKRANAPGRSPRAPTSP